jgi:hypothetical protein
MAWLSIPMTSISTCMQAGHRQALHGSPQPGMEGPLCYCMRVTATSHAARISLVQDLDSGTRAVTTRSVSCCSLSEQRCKIQQTGTWPLRLTCPLAVAVCLNRGISHNLQ